MVTGTHLMILPATEVVSLRSELLDTWDASTILTAFWEGQMAAVAALGPTLPELARAVEAAANRLAAGGRLAYAGAGTSGRIAVQDAVSRTRNRNHQAQRHWCDRRPGRRRRQRFHPLHRGRGPDSAQPRRTDDRDRQQC